MSNEIKPGQYRRTIEVLAKKKVRFILIGGMAAVVHGSARATYTSLSSMAGIPRIAKTSLSRGLVDRHKC
jgi:hypothetical protein